MEAFILFLIAVTLLCLNRSERARLTEELSVGSWMMLMSLIMFALASYGTRLSALFGPYVIVFIPQIIYAKVRSEYKRKNTAAIVALLSMMQYIIRLSINNIGTTMPFTFFWS